MVGTDSLAGSSTTENQTTDPNSQPQAAAGEALFDAVGLPLLRMSAPIYLQLGDRSKLRAQGSGGGSDAVSASVSEIFASAGGAPIVGSTGPINVLPPSIINSPIPAAIPEPGLLLLLAPAFVLGARRLRRRA